MTLLRVLQHVHGPLGWTATIGLLHPALTHGGSRPRALLSAALATTMVTVAALLGAIIYPSYRRDVKPALFAASESLGWAFERKEHLAVAAVAIAWAGLLAHAARVAMPGAGALGVRMTRLARWAYAAAALFAALSALLGLVVASSRTSG